MCGGEAVKDGTDFSRPLRRESKRERKREFRARK